MVPDAFSTFFTTSASVAAALVGLLFVAVSLAPERTVMAGAPVDIQTRFVGAFNALLDAFFVSIAALIPNASMGGIATVTGSVGVLVSLGLLRQVVAHDLLRRRQRAGWRSAGLLVGVGASIYAYQIVCGVQLLVHPADPGPVTTLAWLLIGVYAFGLLRAWELLGAQRFGVLSFFLGAIEKPAPPSDPPAASSPSRSTLSIQRTSTQRTLSGGARQPRTRSHRAANGKRGR